MKPKPKKSDTVTTETRLEFTPEEIREKLGLPPDALLVALSPTLKAGDPEAAVKVGGLVATYSRVSIVDEDVS